jgi:hydrogenase maturation protein HypF
MGRLFDAVAALAGVRQQVNYEAQAAIELEALVDPDENGAYPLEIQLNPQGQRTIPLTGLLSAITEDVYAQIGVPVIAARFHNSIAHLTRQVCLDIHQATGLRQVALSGGVWQNMTLLVKTCAMLRQAGLEPLTHRLVPANDGGIALGQAAIASAFYRS